jgi:hypothetical protein
MAERRETRAGSLVQRRHPIVVALQAGAPRSVDVRPYDATFYGAITPYLTSLRFGIYAETYARATLAAMPLFVHTRHRESRLAAKPQTTAAVFSGASGIAEGNFRVGTVLHMSKADFGCRRHSRHTRGNVEKAISDLRRLAKHGMEISGS